MTHDVMRLSKFKKFILNIPSNSLSKVDPMQVFESRFHSSMHCLDLAVDTVIHLDRLASTNITIHVLTWAHL